MLIDFKIKVYIPRDGKFPGRDGIYVPGKRAGNDTREIREVKNAIFAPVWRQNSNFRALIIMNAAPKRLAWLKPSIKQPVERGQYNQNRRLD